ncbi:hypothetical protein D3C79_983210 [compost metagenome]
MGARTGTGLGDAIVLALERARGVDDQVHIQPLEMRCEVWRHGIQGHVAERGMRLRLKALDERPRRHVRAARGDDMQAILARKPRHQPASEEAVTADDHHPVSMHALV